jgi:hypothetical protein
MSPLFLVNWHRVHVRFRALMWLVAFALAVVMLLSSVDLSGPSAGHGSRVSASHVVAGAVRPAP